MDQFGLKMERFNRSGHLKHLRWRGNGSDSTSSGSLSLRCFEIINAVEFYVAAKFFEAQ